MRAGARAAEGPLGSGFGSILSIINKVAQYASTEEDDAA
jgi:hypothetical protein